MIDPSNPYRVATHPIGEASPSGASEIQPSEAVGDGQADDTEAIEQGIREALMKNGTLMLRSGRTYRITKPLSFFGGGHSVKISANGAGHARLLFDIPRGVGLTFQGSKVGATHSLKSNVYATDKFVQPTYSGDARPGLLCEVISNKSWYHDPRPPSGWANFNLGEARGGTTSELKLSEDFAADHNDTIGRSFTILSGSNLGYARTVTSYSPKTKIVEFSPPLPNETAPGDKYIFNQASKGELNSIERIEGDRLELRNMTFDSYEVEGSGDTPPREQVTLEYFEPVSVHLENLEIEWVTHPTFNNFEGIRVLYGSDCYFRNVSLINCRRIGFQIERSYNTLIDFCQLRHSNNNFLGYGVNVQNSTSTTIRNSWFWGCRRGVDFDSVRDFQGAYPSRLGQVDSCVNYGGGVRNEGSSTHESGWYPREGWDSAGAHNYGFGSHGPAEHITYVNNTIINTYRGIFLRGTNERVLNNRFIGKMEECVGAWFGGNVSIEGNEYTHPSIVGNLEDPDNFRTLLPSNGPDFREQLPKRFLGLAVLNHSPTVYQRGLIRVKNNTVTSLRREFIYHQWVGAEHIEDIVVQHNDIVFDAPDNQSSVFLLNSNNSAKIRRLVDDRNLIKVRNGNFTAFRKNHVLDDTCVVNPHDITERRANDDRAEEMDTSSPISSDTMPERNHGLTVGRVVVKPYSPRSKFDISFHAAVMRPNEAGDVIVALFKNKVCVTARIIRCPEMNVPVEVSLTYHDEDRQHSQESYTVKIGPASHHAGEIVINPQAHNLYGLSKTTFSLREIGY